MSIKESIEQVRSKLTAEQVAEIGSILKVIENEAMDLQASLAAANSESKNRKIEIRTLKGERETLEIELGELDKKIKQFEDEKGNDSRDKKIQELQTELSGFIKRDRDSFINSFETFSKHENFEKAKKRFIIPIEGEDKKPKWDELKDDQWKENIKAFNDLNELEYFGEVKSSEGPIPIKGNPPDGVPTKDEVLEIRAKYGPLSKEYKEALTKHMKKE